MTYDEMNSFILDYLKNDITGRAIMLTGEWGSGKSYYIKNTLKSYLEEQPNRKLKCIIVSLYGLSDVSEISKAIFLGLHPIVKKSDSAVGSAAKVIGKTLMNGLTSFIGFDIGSPDDEGIQKIYESVKLDDTLIVLEDIERTQIDMLKLLGFVNNLCENDGAKILLVTNESELLTTYEKADDKGNKIKYYTDEAVSYKRAKEKTVGDTIHFTCDSISAIQNIIGSFGIFLQKYKSVEKAEDIRDLFALMNSANLRAFIYGCQKSRRILEYISEKHISISDKIEEMVFYGIIAFTQRLSNGTDLHFETDTYLSGRLGLNDKLPLFRFCYDYIMFQMISESEIRKAVNYYTEYLRKGKWNSGRDSDLQIIKGFHVKTEAEVKQAIANIPRKIENGTIPYHDYGVLINYLVAIRYDAGIEFDIDLIVNPILEAMKSSTENIDIEELFSSGYALYTEDARESFETIKLQMNRALHTLGKISFNYEVNSIVDFCTKNTSKLKESSMRERFTRSLDIGMFINMLRRCTSEQISKLRSLFLELYRGEKRANVSEEEILVLKNLQQKISEYEIWECYDKIQKMQADWFVRNLSNILVNLDGDETDDYRGEWINDPQAY